MPKLIWDESYNDKAYELSKSGMSENKIAETLGIAVGTLIRWKKVKKGFAKAIRKGRKTGALMKETSFREYVYDRLPGHLQDVWDKINACENEPNGITRIEELVKDQGKQTRQHLFLYAFVHSNFNASAALRKIGIAKGTLTHWVQTDPDFAALMDEIHWHKKNFFEEALVKLVKRGDPSAIIFVNKTYNKDRGYSDKTEIVHSGTIQHEHNVVPVDTLQLDLEQKKRLLLACRAQKLKDVTNDSAAS